MRLRLRENSAVILWDRGAGLAPASVSVLISVVDAIAEISKGAWGAGVDGLDNTAAPESQKNDSAQGRRRNDNTCNYIKCHLKHLSVFTRSGQKGGYHSRIDANVNCLIAP